MSEVAVVPAEGIVEVWQIGPQPMALLFYADGSWRFRHRCDRGERGVIVCAPERHSTHTVTRANWNSPPTVTPSILCPDCGTHGYVTEGVWSGV